MEKLVVRVDRSVHHGNDHARLPLGARRYRRSPRQDEQSHGGDQGRAEDPKQRRTRV
jgi:hypothetical protein